jgi:hypothetical protein
VIEFHDHTASERGRGEAPSLRRALENPNGVFRSELELRFSPLALVQSLTEETLTWLCHCTSALLRLL